MGIGKEDDMREWKNKEKKESLRNKGEDQKRVTEKERWWIAGEAK